MQKDEAALGLESRTVLSRSLLHSFWRKFVNTLTPHTVTADPSLTRAEAYPLLAVSERKRSGLIICKPHHAEFAGPGAAVGTLIDQECLAIIAIGSPEIVEVSSHEERQRAYGRRIQWIRWLQKITDHSEPLQRVEKLFSGLEAFFGTKVLHSLSDDVLALLAGVLPQTIQIVRSQYRHVGSDASETEPSVIVLNPQSLQTFRSEYAVYTSANHSKALYTFPRSA